MAFHRFPSKDPPAPARRLKRLPSEQTSPYQGPPPTISSGYGGMGQGDEKKNANDLITIHENLVRVWMDSISHRELVQHVKQATKHDLYQKFIDQSPARSMFGQHAKEDLVEFEVWLKKAEIAERLPSLSPPNPPVTPKVSAPAVPEPPVSPKVPAPAVPTYPSPPPAKKVKKEPVEHEDSKAVPLPELTPAEKSAYQQYWSKYKSQSSESGCTTSTSKSTEYPPTQTPQSTGSPPTAGVVTPDVRKRLRLDDGSGHQQAGCGCLFVFLFVVYLHVCV